MTTIVYPSLLETAERVWASSVGKKDYTTTLGDFVGGMENTRTVNSPEGELVLSPHGFRQLARDRFGLPPAIFENKAVRTATKLAILADMVTNGHGDERIKVRINGNQIDSILSNDYSFFDNADLMLALVQLQQQGKLPEKTGVMKFGLDNNGRNMHLRLVSPDDWDFKIGENGHSQPFHGNMVISNNEIAMGSFQARVAITRGSCLNSTIGQSLFAVTHRFANREQFVLELAKASGQIGAYANEMGLHMSHLQNIPIETPLLIFQRIAEVMKVPSYVMNNTIRYWQDNGSPNSLYDIVQSVAAGSREVTVAEGKRKPNWDNRTEIESKLWILAEKLREDHLQGHSVEEFYLTGERGALELAARFAEGFQSETPMASTIADGIRQLEVE